MCLKPNRKGTEKMLINKACCAVRKVCGKGNGDSPYEHVKVEGRGVTATDGTIAARITLPEFSDPHPRADQATKLAEKILHKSDMDIIEKMLNDGDPCDPATAALLTDQGVVRLKGDNVIGYDVRTAQSKLPFENIDFPDVTEIIPDRGRAGSNTIRVSVSEMKKVLMAADKAGVEVVDLDVPDNPDEPVRLDGVNGFTQFFIGVVSPWVNEESR